MKICQPFNIKLGHLALQHEVQIPTRATTSHDEAGCFSDAIPQSWPFNDPCIPHQLTGLFTPSLMPTAFEHLLSLGAYLIQRMEECNFTSASS